MAKNDTPAFSKELLDQQLAGRDAKTALDSSATKPIGRDPIYLGRAFDADIIELCCRKYVIYRLSYRDLVANMA